MAPESAGNAVPRALALSLSEDEARRGQPSAGPMGSRLSMRRRRAFQRDGAEAATRALDAPARGRDDAPMPHLALYQPDIPQNTGTMLRLAACLGVPVEIIEPAGFDVSDRLFRRAGLDYLDRAAIARHASWRAFETWRAADGRRLILATTKTETVYTDLA